MSIVKKELKHAITDAAADCTVKFKNALYRLREDVSGQDLIEYALLIALISLVAIASITAAGTSINSVWNAISANLSTAAS
jgi:pilus assembly protein Flp/PilA